ncbi:hypothetical protein ACOI1A_00780 [Corynebacterium glutamicum]|uniref:hypothetical protein n=1 Tax=Corynebacterium glutamicum TaxID=1718 RepID=UPI003B5A92D6
MTDLDKARKWAECTAGLAHLKSKEIQAAVDVIQSLPNAWVDVEKVQEIIEEMNLPQNRPSATPGLDRGVAIATEAWKRRLEALITPKLPTLADMNEDDRHALVGKDVKVEGWNSPSMLIAVHKNEGAVLGHSWINPWPFVEVRPLSELSPENGAVPTVAEQENDVPDQAVAKDVCNSESNSSETPKSSIKPEDVPANEPWRIEANGQKLVGTRYKGGATMPWSATALNGSFTGDYNDNGITLIHKLVPEPPALPDGMRLADHEEYGRVVVAPRANTHGEEFFYRLGEDSLWGASYGYRPTEEFTFLDGEQ